VVTLNEIFRQAQGSQIIVNAHKINQGQFPDIYNSQDSDFFFVEAEEPEDVLQQIVKLVVQRIPAKYGYHSINEIQVLSPMKRGIVGTENLNLVLQEHLNPQSESIFKSGRKYQIKDKVMQIRNNYQKEVFNGDVGQIVGIDHDEQSVLIRFDDRDIPYEFTELDEIVLAYAVSIHKYQGSECQCIVMPVHTTHFKLLHRNLLYTGVTRGKKLVILVGTKKAVALAVRNDEIKERHTGLKQALLGIMN
jgi:exodeoxyribonuclease V alpha subunit